MKKRFLPIVAFLFSACSIEGVTEEPLTTTEQSSIITISEALKNLDSFYETINSSGGITRSQRNRAIDEIITVKPSDIEVHTKSSDESFSTDEPLVYLINYQNDGGYAILAANSNLPDPVIAVTEKGTIDGNLMIEDNNVSQESDFSAFMQNVIGNYLVNVGSDDQETEIETRNNTALLNVSPLFPNWWYQEAEFSKYCLNEAGERCLVGCVGLATAMALCRYKKNSSFVHAYGTNYNCKDMQDFLHSPKQVVIQERESLADSVFRYVADVAKAVHTTFGTERSHASLQEAAIYFHSIQIYTAERHLNYKLDYVTDMLPSGKPVVMAGFNNITFSHGHAWIVDGIQQSYKSNGSVATYLHCNWGYWGVSNGYYASKVFSPRTGPEYQDVNIDNTASERAEHNYNCYYRTLTY
ncbi:MAG: C10 family peptidase [Bacteroidales bacterium]|nr:C10 family peptidase [Bacteroidales bacterium]